MAVTIDEMQVDTQMPAPSASAPAAAAKPQQTKDIIKAELKRLRERALRLRAD
jgi:hypothetical protein